MTSNTWGPASFVIMAPENFSPNNPSGEYIDLMRKGYLSIGGETKAVVGIIDKDGNFLEGEYNPD